MSEASFDLSYIRRWACEKLETTNDVATLCGMLTDLARHVHELEVENEQLWKVANLCGEYIGDGRCEGCVVKPSCNTGGIECWMKVKLTCMLRDHGIEVS